MIERGTEWCTCFTMSTKCNVIQNLEKYMSIVLPSENQSPIEYHSDGPPELISKKIVLLLAQHRCRQTYSSPYTPELNGMSEQDVQQDHMGLCFFALQQVYDYDLSEIPSVE